jgi:F0F1-type ATP synthase delta subunit
MSDTKIANRYSEALMQQAIADNQLQVVADNMLVINTTCKNSQDLTNALKNPIINLNQKQEKIFFLKFLSHFLICIENT